LFLGEAEDGRDELDLIPVQTGAGVVDGDLVDFGDLFGASADGGVVCYGPGSVVCFLGVTDDDGAED